MVFELVKEINLICAMKKITKSNCNLCMEESLTILKKLREKCVMFMNNNLDIYGALWHKKTSHQFFLSTDDPIWQVKGIYLTMFFKS